MPGLAQAGIAQWTGWCRRPISRAEAPAINALHMKAVAAWQCSQHIALLIVLTAHRACTPACNRISTMRSDPGSWLPRRRLHQARQQALTDHMWPARMTNAGRARGMTGLSPYTGTYPLESRSSNKRVTASSRSMPSPLRMSTPHLCISSYEQIESTLTFGHEGVVIRA